MRIAIRKGLDLPIEGEPDPRIDDGPPIRTVALLGPDCPGVRTAPQVEPGDRVRLGQAVLADRRRPEIRVTAPGSGVVRAVNRGERRALESLVIELDGDEEERFASHSAGEIERMERSRVVAQLLASGLWCALRARPYDSIPGPSGAPGSVFVTAIDTEPLAPRPEWTIALRAADFEAGLSAVARLTDGPVFLCKAPGAEIPAGDPDRITIAEFAGPHPAGLVGTHIHHLDPVGPDRSVWHVGYQDAIAIGALFTRGRLSVERVVALAGPAVRRPRLLRTRLGASTEELVRGELRDVECRVVSGSVLSGRRAAGHGAYLGRYHHQVCAVVEGEAPRGRWLAPGRGGRAVGLLRRGAPWTTSRNGRPAALLPLGTFDRVVPLDLQPAPLLRALASGDTESALELGALELAEEDLALCAFLCPSKLDYGPLLRSTLDELERSA